MASELATNAPDVEADLEQSRLFNADLAAIPLARRKWGALSFAALWISRSACIPFVCRRCQLNVAALYQTDSEYQFTRGISVVAMVSLVMGARPSLPGFLITVKLLDAGSVPPWFAHLYDYAWFIGFAVAFVVYLAGRKLLPRA